MNKIVDTTLGVDFARVRDDNYRLQHMAGYQTNQKAKLSTFDKSKLTSLIGDFS